MIDPMPDEFSDVSWDIHTSSHTTHNNDAPAVVDPLSDANDSTIETEAYTHTRTTTQRTYITSFAASWLYAPMLLYHLENEQKPEQQISGFSAQLLTPESVHTEASYEQAGSSAVTGSKLSDDWKIINVVEPRKEQEGGFISYLIVSAVCSLAWYGSPGH